jgi:hypothetical protein
MFALIEMCVLIVFEEKEEEKGLPPGKETWLENKNSM